jgi:hypothetical protein
VQEEENEVDLSLLPEKEKNKIFNQRTRDAKKATNKANREATKAAAKALRETTVAAAKEARKTRKSKAQSSPLHLTETSIASPSQNPRKHDSSIAQFSVSRLQQLASSSLMDSAGGALHIQEFFFSGSLLSTDAYYLQQKAFPKERVDMKAFLEMVCIFSYLFNASCWKCSSFAMNFILNVVFNVQYKSDKARAFKGEQSTAGRVDLMIVDIPEGLPIPMVSSPPTSVPQWNSEDKNFLPILFTLRSSLVHDNGVLLLFHKDDPKFRASIRGFAKAYHFSIMKDWTGINRLPITSARQECHNRHFLMKITVRTSFSSGPPPASAFIPRTGFYHPRTW